MPEQKESLKLYKRACKVIPGGAQVISKQYGRVPYGVAPAFITHGKGCKVWDWDGNEYIDWSASLGPVTLGYDFFDLQFGDIAGHYPLPYRDPSLPMSHPKEVVLAEKLIDHIPCAQMVRFFKTGSEACSAAVRLARAATGRKWVVCMGYHGWHDWYASTLPYPRDDGVMHGQFVHKVNYGEIPVELGEAACVILEPMSRLCPEKASPGYLKELQAQCKLHGAALIFDEIIMGFRHALAGGQEFYGITPDLALFSKGMANGYPMAALVGRRDLMQEVPRLQISGTFCGDIMGLDMALRTLGFYEKNNVIDKLWRTGNYLSNQVIDLILENNLDKIIHLKGFGPWTSFVWEDKECENLFLQEVFDRGVFYNRDHFPMWSHNGEAMQKTLDAYNGAFEVVVRCREQGTVAESIRGKIDRGLFP